MFSTERDASKVALTHLVARLKFGGFRLLDTQFQTDHLSGFGAEEISRAEYAVRLAEAIDVQTDFSRLDPYAGGVAAMQVISQAS
jgi:leucyl/phenylalanyl-tRNA--protein transferase